MDSSDLTPEQAQQLSDQIRRHLNCLYRLRSHMDRRGFPTATIRHCDSSSSSQSGRAYDAPPAAPPAVGQPSTVTHGRPFLLKCGINNDRMFSRKGASFSKSTSLPSPYPPPSPSSRAPGRPHPAQGMLLAMTQDLPWWKRAVIYEVWLRSFFDSNGDGIGDLPGLINKLDYVQRLGAQAVWLSPIFPSPWADAGYDISDFCGVHPQLGTVEDFDRLVTQAHRRDVRIILDWPINHTSDQHPWFQDARSGRVSRYRNWYLWADPKLDGSPPNNWLSVFGGSAWTLDDESGQYYFHAFLPQQPDLNWRNPEVSAAIYDAMRCWLARGVDGFRIDAVDMLLENADLPDNPPNPHFDPSGPLDAAVFQVHNRNQPGVHQHIAALRSVCDEFGERVLLGEVYTSPEDLARYIGSPEQPELHLPLNPQLLDQRWGAEAIASAVSRYVQALPPHGWPTWAWSNHDFHRLAERAQGEELRLAAMLLLTLRGTPLIYYGEEIGMGDVDITPDVAEDPQGRSQPTRNRDVARTPMQWSSAPHAGFTTGIPYLPVGGNFAQVNVESQERNARSLLALYRRLVALRRAEPVLLDGIQTPIVYRPPLLLFRREGRGRRLMIVINMAGDNQSFDFSDVARQARLLLSSYLDRDNESSQQVVRLRSKEGVILAVE
jgi:alpha-glucosidase